MKQLAKTLLQNLPLKSPIYNGLRNFPLPERLYRHLHFTGAVTIPVGAQAAFRINHYGYQVENDIYWAGFGQGWEATSLRSWVALARGATCILDIGANTGVYALSALAVNPHADITAFEPVERICERLRANVALNDAGITVEQCGVSDHNEGAVLYDVAADHAYSASLEYDMLGPRTLGPRTDGTQSAIKTLRMDRYLDSRVGLDRLLVKIDVERHELPVLAGFGQVIALHRPSFLIEVLDADHFNEIAAVFAPHNYVTLEIQELVGCRPVTNFGGAARNYLYLSTDVAVDLGWELGISHDELAI